MPTEPVNVVTFPRSFQSFQATAGMFVVLREHGGSEQDKWYTVAAWFTVRDAAIRYMERHKAHWHILAETQGLLT